MLKVKRKRVINKCSRRCSTREKVRKENDGSVLSNEKVGSVIIPSLNSDILRNIFTRLQPDVLYNNFKHQCKEWYDILSEPNFNNGILICSNPGLLFIARKSHGLMVGFMEFEGLDLKLRELSTFNFELSIISCSNGLVLVQKELEYCNSLYILNPLTEESVEIPPCEHNCVLHDLVYVPTTKKCMLVDVFNRSSTGDATFHIRSIGGDTWNDSYCSSDILKDVRVLNSYTHMFANTFWNERISIDGILYVNLGLKRKIVALDLHNEEIKLLDVPVTGEAPVKIMELAGFLSAVNGIKNELSEATLLDIWVLKDINTGEWEHRIRIDDLEERFMWCDIVGLNNGQTLVFKDEKDEKDVLAYDVQTRQWKLTTVNDWIELFHSLHVNTLASIR